MDRWWSLDDDCDCFDEDEDRLSRGLVECPKCGEAVPKDHLDTDSGNCIGCEDRESDEREAEEERLAAPYANCLLGLQPKKRGRKK